MNKLEANKTGRDLPHILQPVAEHGLNLFYGEINNNRVVYT